MRANGGEWHKLFTGGGQLGWGKWVFSTPNYSPDFDGSKPAQENLHAGLNTIELSGRSEPFKIDRIHLHKQGTQNPPVTTPESPRGNDNGGGGNTGGDGDEKGDVRGERFIWYPLEIWFKGHKGNEMDTDPNPFLDYRLTVTFTSPSGKKIDVPGFFDGDGAGGELGDVWKVRFTPDAVGNWSYSVDLRIGKNVAIGDGGNPINFHGETGTFTIAASPPGATGFLKKGRVARAG
ncbi:MAG: DUF5060 domain-containing protein, partial [bacterium]|nr:DUF5060 domain-containing protein [bacterium]